MDDECFFNQNEENKDRFIFCIKYFKREKAKKKSIPFPHFNSNSNPVQTMFHFRFLFFDLFNQKKIEKLQHQFISSGCCCWNTMSSSSLHLYSANISEKKCNKTSMIEKQMATLEPQEFFFKIICQSSFFFRREAAELRITRISRTHTQNE